MLSEAEVVAQLDAADEKYRTGATGTPVQDDQDDREALDAAHTAIENDEFPDLNTDPVSYPNVTAEVYTGGNIVTPVDAGYFQQKVYDAVQSGDVFTTGAPYTDDYTLAAPYVDPLTLIEASKLTGEKWF